MRIVIFTHPSFLSSQSMPRFAAMLANGLKDRNHNVQVWAPKPRFQKLLVTSFFKKWMGYVDQYVMFPLWVRKKLKKCSFDTLFVFADQALGPWIPLVADRPHIIHCHDFLAQLSALGEIAENPTSNSGQRYQAYIRKGYQKGQNFISVSKKTQKDLHVFLDKKPKISEVVYNGLNQHFQANDKIHARLLLGEETCIDMSRGYLLHVGGNQWYKNRIGVIEIYNAWRKCFNNNLPLIMIGALPNEKLLRCYESSPYKNEIHILSGQSDEFVRKAYNGASLFLFPSLAEGFGWPIAEAMASGCLVITTDEAPMTEVGGNAAWYISRRPKCDKQIKNWAEQSAEIVNKLCDLTDIEREKLILDGINYAKRFDAEATLNKIEAIYQKVLKQTVVS